MGVESLDLSMFAGYLPSFSGGPQMHVHLVGFHREAGSAEDFGFPLKIPYLVIVDEGIPFFGPLVVRSNSWRDVLGAVHKFSFNPGSRFTILDPSLILGRNIEFEAL